MIETELDLLHNRLTIISHQKYNLINNNVKKSDPGYRKLTLEQSGIEQNINKIKTERKKSKLEKKIILKEDIQKPLPDDYTGIRCDYCGGEMVDSICVNKSEDWPHE